jgi:hypothetical protein
MPQGVIAAIHGPAQRLSAFTFTRLTTTSFQRKPESAGMTE